jgi:hypothetical protein
MPVQSSKNPKPIQSEIQISMVSDFQSPAYGNAPTFQVSRSGQVRSYEIQSGYGFFVPAFTKAKGMDEVGDLLDKNLLSEDIATDH